MIRHVHMRTVSRHVRHGFLSSPFRAARTSTAPAAAAIHVHVRSALTDRTKEGISRRGEHMPKLRRRPLSFLLARAVPTYAAVSITAAIWRQFVNKGISHRQSMPDMTAAGSTSRDFCFSTANTAHMTSHTAAVMKGDRAAQRERMYPKMMTASSMMRHFSSGRIKSTITAAAAIAGAKSADCITHRVKNIRGRRYTKERARLPDLPKRTVTAAAMPYSTI